MKDAIKIILVLTLVISCGTPPIVTMCVPSPHFGHAYCGLYDFKKLEYIEEPEVVAYDIEVVEASFCMDKDDWLKKMKPWLKEQYRKKNDGD